MMTEPLDLKSFAVILGVLMLRQGSISASVS